MAYGGSNRPSKCSPKHKDKRGCTLLSTSIKRLPSSPAERAGRKSSGFGDVVDSRSDEARLHSSSRIIFQRGTFFVCQNGGVLMSTHLYEKCDLTLLNSACKSFYFDAYVWNGDRGTSNDDTVDSSPITIPYSTRAIHWNPLDELLILFRYQAEVAWTGNVSSVDLNQGLFHASRRTFTGCVILRRGRCIFKAFYARRCGRM